MDPVLIGELQQVENAISEGGSTVVLSGLGGLKYRAPYGANYYLSHHGLVLKD